MAGEKYTPSELAAMQEAAANGYTLRQTASLLGRSYDSVRMSARHHAVKFRLDHMGQLPHSECKKGHSLTGDNLYVSPKGRRRCLICHKAWNKRPARERTSRPFTNCELCGTQVKRYGRRFCSQACAWKAAAGIGSHTIRHREDVREQLRAMWAETKADGPLYSAKTIGIKLGLTKNAVIGLVHRMGLPSRPSPLGLGRPFKPRAPKPPRVKIQAEKKTPPRMPGRYAFRPKAVPKARVRIPGIPIPLREVYRLAGELNVPRSKAGDINAVSDAMRKADPSHPGFRLAA